MRTNFVATEVVTGLRRNLTMTVAMIITTAISLLLFGGGLLIAREISQMKALYADKVEISVFLKDDITDEQRGALEQDLTDSPEVQKVTYLSQEDAFDRFQRLFAAQPELADQVGPTDLPASFQVRMVDSERYQVISQQFSGADGVKQVQSQNALLDRIFGFFNIMRNAAIVLAVFQAVAALLLISNTVQVAAFTRRTETGIMRLVGASRWYTQLPFLLEAAVAGLIGALIAVGLLISLKLLFFDKAFGDQIRSGVVPPLGWDAIAAVSPVVAGLGVALAGIAAYVTLRLYVRL